MLASAGKLRSSSGKWVKSSSEMAISLIEIAILLIATNNRRGKYPFLPKNLLEFWFCLPLTGFRDPLRDWVSDLWANFWDVSPARVAAMLAVIVFALTEGAVWIPRLFVWLALFF